MGKRKNINTTIDEDLYQETRILALRFKKNANDFIEEGMRYINEKYTKIIKDEEATRQTIASLKISGFEFINTEVEEMWSKVAAGEMTAEDVRKVVFDKVERLQIEHPECFVKPDK